MPDEYCRALCELADDVPLAVTLMATDQTRRLGDVVEQAGTRAVALSDRLLRAFCPILPRKEAVLLIEALYQCILAAQLTALTRPSNTSHDALNAALCRLASHLHEEIASLPRLLRGKRDVPPLPSERAAVQEEAYRIRTQLLLHMRQTGAVGDAVSTVLCYDTLLRTLGDAETRYLALALECS